MIRRALLPIALLLVLTSQAFGQAGGPPPPRPVRKGSKYTVKIDSSPQQAAIYLDDKSYGIFAYTPWSGRLVKGDYKVILELPGYKPLERTIRVDATTHDFFLPLEKQILPGTIDVQAVGDPNVVGANVSIDGQPKGTAPLVVEVPVPENAAEGGRFLVEIKKPGFNDFQQWVNVQAGNRVTLAPVLKAVAVEAPKGSLLVDADVPDAEVYVDGRRAADTTPTIVDGLDEGSHVVEVKKAPAVPWKQTVFVKGGQRTKLTATLASTMPQQAKGGNVRVLSNVPDADVWLDGVVKGHAPMDLNDVPAGDHIVNVKAKGYVDAEQKITVQVGQSVILKLDLKPAASTAGTGHVIVHSSVPEAKVFIDGGAAGNVPQERDLPAGSHTIVVQRDGFAPFESKVDVVAGQNVTINADLKAVGGVRFVSSTPGAAIVLDGLEIGKTPMDKNDIAVGEHIVTFRLPGYHDAEVKLNIVGGKSAIVNAEMVKIDTGLSPEQKERKQRGLSSYGARTMPSGHFTVDAATGYPYWAELRATVGVADENAYGIDVGVGFRSYLTEWEFLLGGRYRFFEQSPFAFAAFANVGGGGGLAGRNQFTLQGGAIASIAFEDYVTVSARGWLDVWSDRLCESTDYLATMNQTKQTDGPSVCQDDFVAGNPGDGKIARAKALTGKDWSMPFRGRDSGAMFYTSLVVEAAVQQNMSVFVIFEGAPGQGERAAHTNIFNGTLLSDHDPNYSGKIGLTFKF